MSATLSRETLHVGDTVIAYGIAGRVVSIERAKTDSDPWWWFDCLPVNVMFASGRVKPYAFSELTKLSKHSS